MWNDRETPPAYLITFRAYGTWPHGDDRGSTDRHNNIYGNPHYPPNAEWLAHNNGTLAEEPVILDAARRGAVGFAISDTCRRRFWGLMAMSIRTNHAHAVVDTLGKGWLSCAQCLQSKCNTRAASTRTMVERPESVVPQRKCQTPME